MNSPTRSADLHDVLAAVLRNDLVAFIRKSYTQLHPAQPFQPNWHVEALAHALTRVATGECTRLIITLPPRYLKSVCASVAFPAWVLGRDPTQRIISVSYGADLAVKLAVDSRAIMRSPWYRQTFPGTVLGRDKNTEHDLRTTRGGGRFTTSVGGVLTGRGGNLIVVDDPLKPDEALSDVSRTRVNNWFSRTLYSRLDDKRHDRIVLIMQRLHADDLIGYALGQEAWEHLNLPALAETDALIPIAPGRLHRRRVGDVLHAARESRETLDKIRQTMGSFVFQAQYQQCPVPADGEIIKWGWFRRYRDRPSRQRGDLIVQSWDTASKAGERHDYSVCTTWLMRDREYFLLDVFRERLEYPQLKQAVIGQALRYWANRILIEDSGVGTGLIAELRFARIENLPRPIAIVPTTDKITRLSVESAVVEAGSVTIPEKAPWLEAFRTELLQFPQGRHDDQVDSFSQFLNWAAPRNRVYARQRSF